MNRPSPWTIGLLIGFILFNLCIGGCAVRTYLLPNTFMGVTRIHFKPPDGGTEASARSMGVRLLDSDLVLVEVVRRLDLNVYWGSMYYGTRLKTSESLALLRQRIVAHPVKNSPDIVLRAFSEDPYRAAGLANAVAEAARDLPASKSLGIRTEIVLAAVPVMDPVAPSIIVELCKGLLVGLLIGIPGGVLTAWIVSSRNLRAMKHPAPA